MGREKEKDVRALEELRQLKRKGDAHTAAGNGDYSSSCSSRGPRHMACSIHARLKLWAQAGSAAQLTRLCVGGGHGASCMGSTTAGQHGEYGNQYSSSMQRVK